MTGGLRMLDSIDAASLPPGADAYLGYVNGHWPTYAALVAQFPAARILSLTVFPGARADGCDCETGDLTVAQVPGFVQQELAAEAWRPVVYMGAANTQAVLAALSAAGIARASVRLLSAHYGTGKHICGPGTCGYPQADGTQWTDTAPGVGGAAVDESLLAAGFFGAPPPVPLLEDGMLLITPLTGEPVPLAIPNGTARLRFYSNKPATIRVDFFNVQPTAELVLGYGQAAGVAVDGAECAQVYLVAGDGSAIAYTPTA